MWSRLHVRWGNLPHVTSPTWGPPPSCKQALSYWLITDKIWDGYQLKGGITKNQLSDHFKVKKFQMLGGRHPWRPRGSQLGWEKRLDESFQGWAAEPRGTDSHRAGSDWAQKMLCIIVPDRRTESPEFFFVSSYTTAVDSITACLSHAPKKGTRKRKVKTLFQ